MRVLFIIVSFIHELIITYYDYCTYYYSTTATYNNTHKHPSWRRDEIVL